MFTVFHMQRIFTYFLCNIELSSSLSYQQKTNPEFFLYNFQQHYAYEEVKKAFCISSLKINMSEICQTVYHTPAAIEKISLCNKQQMKIELILQKLSRDSPMISSLSWIPYCGRHLVSIHSPWCTQKDMGPFWVEVTGSLNRIPFSPACYLPVTLLQLCFGR